MLLGKLRAGRDARNLPRGRGIYCLSLAVDTPTEIDGRVLMDQIGLVRSGGETLKMSLRHLLEATACVPRAALGQAGAPRIFGEVVAAFAPEDLQEDRIERHNAGVASVLLELSEALNSQFGTQTWRDGRSPRCVALPCAGIRGRVNLLCGSAILIPGATDVLAEHLRLTRLTSNGIVGVSAEPTFLCPVVGRHGPELTARPPGRYVGQSRLIIGFQPGAAAIIAPGSATPGCVYIDCDAGLASTDYDDQEVAVEMVGDGARRWQILDATGGRLVTELVPVATVKADQEGEPWPLPVLARPRGLFKTMFGLTGGKVGFERHEPSLDGPLPAASEPAPRPQVGPPPSVPTGRDGDKTVVIVPPRGIAAAAVAVAATASDLGLHAADQPTIIMGPAKPLDGYRLELAMVALPRVDECNANGWTLAIGASGALAGDTDVVLGASAAEAGLWHRLPGQPPRPLTPQGDLLTVADCPGIVVLPPTGMERHFIGLLEISSSEVLTITTGTARIFGRPNTDDRDTLFFSPMGSMQGQDGRPAQLGQVNLSRRHLTLYQLHRQLHAAMAEGRMPAWKLSADRSVVGRIDPGASDELVLNDGEYLVVGCHVVRYRAG